MRRATVTVLAGILLVIGSGVAVLAEGPDLTELRVVLANAAIPLGERGRRALEGAAGLDQAAQQATVAADRFARWSEAVGLLDDFVAKNPGVESAPLIRFQAAVYRWAEGRSLAQQADLVPADAPAREGAVRALDDAIKRLRAVAIPPAEAAEAFGQNVRFRLAQAIADRAKLEPEGDAGRHASEREALGLLDASPSAPGLRPFVRLLRSELAIRLRLFGQAQMEIEQAEKLTPPPPATPLLEAKVAALIGRSLFEEARAAIGAAKVDEPIKGLLTLRIALTRRRERAPGLDRKAIDAEAFRIAETFRGSSRPEGRRALMELARTIDEPAADAPPEWWDLLAEGHLRLGDTVRAGRLLGKGAIRAESLGLTDKAAAYRTKAGACLFEGGKFAEADVGLSRVVDAAQAPRDLKARAGMLRALARGRAVATREPGGSKAAYLAALEQQVRDFPDDPSSGEARWLLGQVRFSAGRADEALALWGGIPHGHPRWMESRMLIADRLREAVEAQRINRDVQATKVKMDLARQSLRAALDAAAEGTEYVAMALRLVRLELIPDAGQPSEAIDACGRLLRRAAHPEQHQLARLYRMVALAQLNRFVEAERVARDEARSASSAILLEILRLLDRSATEVEAEASRRRFGLISQVLSGPLVDRIDDLPSVGRDEARLHRIRAFLFSGDPAAARREIASWTGLGADADDEMLRELADTYLRLEAYALAIDAERYRASRLAPGSLPWLEARYGLALAQYRSDHPQEARKIIEATAILHPDLGGGELRVKFEKLSQRIGRE